MNRQVLMTAALTGMSCAGIAAMVDWTTDMFERIQIVFAVFISSLLGILIAQTLLGKMRGAE